MKYLLVVTFKTGEQAYLDPWGELRCDPVWDNPQRFFKTEEDALAFAQIEFADHPEVKDIAAMPMEDEK